MFKKMPFLLLALFLVIGFFHDEIPLYWKSIIYGVSLSIKSLILFFLPLVIFGLIFKTASGLAKTASKTIVMILGMIIISNFISTMISYCVGTCIYQLDISLPTSLKGNDLSAIGVITLPHLIGNSTAMLGGLGLGIILGRWRPYWTDKVSQISDRIIGILLQGFLYVIPLFISGFVLKMFHDGLMFSLFKQYGLILVLVACSVFAYILLIHFFASRLQSLSFRQSMQNMLPAVLTGFGSMSSAAAMPLTLIGVEKNSKNSDFAKSLIPATVNAHLIGDCFAIPIFAFAILKSFGLGEPSFVTYFVFALYFVIAKFSVAAVPGGGILVMLPILQQFLGFDATMLSLITSLYILFDPVITSANVLGNGGFAVLVSSLLRRKWSWRSS